MEKIKLIGLEINKISITQLFLSKTMLLAYFFLAIAVYGVYDVLEVRYFSAAANAYASGLDPLAPGLKEAMKLAVFGEVGEVNRFLPWTLFIVNYIYMIYTGSGIIFLVALAELLHFKLVAKTAAGFMAVGISMVFAGLFTIGVDSNIPAMLWMFITPNFTSGMWLMVPLYSIYIPFVLFEIYLLLTNKRALAKKLMFPILVASIVVDVVEYYIQARLFSMNTARHLWTEFPFLTFYYIISAFVSALGVMGIYTFLVYRNKTEYAGLMHLIQKTMLFFVSVLGLYEIIGYLSVDKEWAFLILFGPFKTAYFGGYIMLALALPFLFTVKSQKPIYTLFASICAVVGGFIGRYVFVYGGSANPMSNRFGLGYEKYDIYALAKSFTYVAPHLGEICIAVGSLGIILAVYKLLDGLLSVSDIREHH